MLPLDPTTQQRVTAGLAGPARRRADAGLADFSAMAMPGEKEEAWRYVDLSLDLAEYAVVETPGEPMAAMDGGVPGVVGRAVNVDGHTILAEGGDGIGVTAFRDDQAELELGAPSDRIDALHDAFACDGVTVSAARAAAGTVLVDLQAVTPGVAASPRVVVSAAEGASLSVIVLQHSPDGMAALMVPSFEVSAEAAARISLTVVQTWGDETIAVARHRMRAGRDASVGLAEAGFGGRFSRLHLGVELVGNGAGASIVGAYFGDREQTLDYRYFMRHGALSTTSEMFLKGAVADHARSVFSGLIRIEPEGQKSNAHQTNRNLVLSDGAEAHSVPNLEILANDVRCGHGSAVGPLDEEQRYYLMSRGLDPDRADRLQVKGFFEDALVRFPHRELDAMLRGIAMAKYARVTA
ncbi:MAG TPA: SufD family Fe-S cluster assembly protein [Acidimicrobiia bacterium]|nr:SufD family Fe-S cluster assembly protein [Acidimicrobiia bacterium]